MSNEELKTIEEIKQLANIIDVSAKELQTGLRNLLDAKEVQHTPEQNKKNSSSMKEYYKNHSSKSIGRISEKRKGVVGIRGSETLLFKCVKYAANAVFGSRANIVRSCNSKTRTAYGYRWMWETDFCSYGGRKDGAD